MILQQALSRHRRWLISLASAVVSVGYAAVGFAVAHGPRAETVPVSSALSSALSLVQELQSAKVVSPSSVGEILALDVLGYNNLTDSYASDLEVRVFKRTNEYSQKLEELRKKRDELLTSTVALEVRAESLGTYDVSTHRFDIFGRSNADFGNSAEAPTDCVRIDVFAFCFPKLPWRRVRIKDGEDGERSTFLEFKTDETTALRIERAKSANRLKIYLVFRPVGLRARTFEFLNLATRERELLKGTFPEGKDVRIIVADGEEVLVSQIFR